MTRRLAVCVALLACCAGCAADPAIAFQWAAVVLLWAIALGAAGFIVGGLVLAFLDWRDSR